MESFDVSGSRFAGLEMFCDGCIISKDGRQFPIHRVIVASASKYFRDRLVGQLNERPKHQILISRVEGNTLKSILSYIYSDRVNLTPDNISGVLTASDYLMMERLVDVCCSVLKDLLSPANCIELLNVAYALSHLDIYDTCLRYAQTHFSLAMRDSEARGRILRQLSFEPFHRLLGCDLNVDDEELVWQVIVEWTSKDLQLRLASVTALLLRVRLEDASEELVQSIAAHPYVCNNEHCSHLNLQLKDIKDSFLSESPELRLPSRQTSKRYLCVTNNEEGGLDVVISFDDQLTDGKWSTLGHKPDFVPTSTFQVGTAVFVFRLRLGYGFDLVQRSWFELPPTNRDLFDYQAVCAGDSIYCIGGNHDEQHRWIFFMERYVAAENRWTAASSLPVTTTNLSSVRTVGGHIYARVKKVDPYNPYRVRDAGYLYDPPTDSWARASHAPSELKTVWPGIDFEGKLYLFGKENVNRVWRLDPETSVWSFVNDLPGGHYYLPEAKVLDGSLVVYETDNVCAPLPKLRWVPETNEWKEIHVNDELCKSHLFEINDVGLNRELRSALSYEKWVNRF